MPLKLVPPRKGKSPNWSIRGSYLGVPVDKSSGTHKRSVARTVLNNLERAIERGEYPPKQVAAGEAERTFIKAAVDYMEAGRGRRYVAKLIKHFGATPLSEIDQPAIDNAAVALFPNATAATRNRAVYTPMSAILRLAGTDIKLRRPKGAKGRVVTDWLRPEDAAGIIQAADRFDGEFALLLRFLLFCGVRLGEALGLRWEDIDTANGTAWVRREKDGIHSDVRMRADLCERITAHGPKAPERRVFRFHQGGNLKHKLTRAKLTYLGVACPTRRPTHWQPPMNRLQWVNFHTFRHTWATWMRRAGTDVQGLVATGNWRDPRSAARYAHVVPREEWQRVDALPSVEKTGNVA
jgi:integrase